MCSRMGLEVNNIEVEGKSSIKARKVAKGQGWPDKALHPDGWKVSFIDEDGQRFALPIRFARKQDAEAAKKAIEDEIDWSGTAQRVYDQIVEYGPRRLKQKMVDAMAW